MEIDSQLAVRALNEALEKFPQFSQYAPRLAWRDLYQGGTFFVEYGSPVPAGSPGVWDFQNAVVKGYKALAGA